MTTDDTEVRPRPNVRTHPVEFALGLFGDVRPGEAATALLLTLTIFLLLTAYYLLKVAREPLILAHGAEVKSYASLGQSILTVLMASAYSWLASRVNRMTLIACVTLFFAGNLLVFALLQSRGASIGVPFFLWVGVFNLVTIAQFWSFAADTYTEEQGKRLFVIIGIGSSIGAVSGAWLARPLIVHGPAFLMLIAAVLLLVALGLTYLTHHREAMGAPKGQPSHHKEPIGTHNAFSLIAHDRYLLLFAALIFSLNFVTKTGDYVLDRMLVLRAPAEAHALGIHTAVYIGQFKARYFEWINSLGVILQMFVVSRVIKYAGLRIALVLVPAASLVGYGLSFALPLLSVLLVTRVAESTLDYSLSNTTRQALWLVTPREAKYKAKQVIDTFVMRFGDTVSAGCVWLGVRFAFGPRTFLALNVVLSVAWIGAALVLGKEYILRGGSNRPSLAPREKSAAQATASPKKE